MSEKMKTGKHGESIAARYLEAEGYKVIGRNFRAGRGEIDLIVSKADWVLFVEVKTRSSTTFGEPEEFVTPAQLNRIYDCAEEWIFLYDWKGHIRFDIIAITLGEPYNIEHFQDAIN